MPTVNPPAKVLVTGANGYIAVWIVKDLLDQGYAVRGTVRSEQKTAHLRNIFKAEVDKGRLEFVTIADITQPGAFDEAVKGIDAIAHTASPFHFQADDPNELIEPAVKGTIGVLQSALRLGGTQIKRIVITSSSSAVSDSSHEGILDERDWNENNIVEIREKGCSAPNRVKYRASKSLAEKTAWAFVEEHKNEISWDLVAINPPYVFGPIIHEISSPETLNTSMHLFYEAIFSKKKTPEELSGFQGSFVDVRDVARAHVRAIEVEEAGGQRIIASGGEFIWQDWFDAVNALDIPGLQVPEGIPGAGKAFKFRIRYRNEKARTLLGLEFRDKLMIAHDTVVDMQAKGWCQ